MIRNKQIVKRILEGQYPITMLVLEPMRTKKSVIRFDISIEYENGSKYILDDFYKRISTIEEQ